MEKKRPTEELLDLRHLISGGQMTAEHLAKLARQNSFTGKSFPDAADHIDIAVLALEAAKQALIKAENNIQRQEFLNYRT